jgi:hypothetical protein
MKVAILRSLAAVACAILALTGALFFYFPLRDLKEFEREFPATVANSIGLLERNHVWIIRKITGLRLADESEEILSLGGGVLLKCKKISDAKAACEITYP